MFLSTEIYSRIAIALSSSLFPLHKLAGGQPGYKFIRVKLLNPESIGKVHFIHSEKSNPHITCRLESLARLNRVALYSIVLLKK